MKDLTTYINESTTVNENANDMEEITDIVVNNVPYSAESHQLNKKDLESTLTDEVLKKIQDAVKSKTHKTLSPDKIKAIALKAFDDEPEVYEI